MSPPERGARPPRATKPLLPTALAMARGAFGFAAVSVAAFSVWAFGGRYFKGHGGEPAMYVAIAGVFLALSGILLYPLVRGPARFARFYLVFVPSFVAYALAWCAAWSAFPFHVGEWLGSIVGTCLFAVVSGSVLRNLRPWYEVIRVLFVAHSAGYFLGEAVWKRLAHSTTGMLVWGLLYGLGFGAGIAFAFFSFQARPPRG